MRSALVRILKADMIYAQECLGAESARFCFFGSPTATSREGAREHIMRDPIVAAAKEVFGEENVAAACCVHFSAGLMGKISMKDAVDQDNALRVLTGLFNDSFALRCEAKGGETSEELFLQRSAAARMRWLNDDYRENQVRAQKAAKAPGSQGLANLKAFAKAASAAWRAAFFEATKSGHGVHPDPDVARAVEAWDVANANLFWARRPLAVQADESNAVIKALAAYRKELERQSKKIRS